MKNRLFLATLAMFFLVSNVAAQEKYDIAIVSYQYDTPKSHIIVSTNGEKFESFDVEKEELQGKVWGISANPLIKQVNKMQSEGWEVFSGMSSSYNSSTGVSFYYFTMRKKK